MENASKALIMAASTLIGILVISLGVYIFTSFGQTTREVNQKNEEQQLVKFNAQFTTYLDRDDITIYDIRTVAGMAKENNERYDNDKNDEHYITVTLTNCGEIQTKGSDYFDTLIKNDLSEIKNSNLELTKYKLTSSNIAYNTNGQVNRIEFKK